MKTDAFNSSDRRSDVSEGDNPDRKRSLSMMMTLGMVLANGARADARDSRERVRRQLDRAQNFTVIRHFMIKEDV